MTPYNIVYVVATGLVTKYGPVPFIASAGPGEALATVPDGPPDVLRQRYDGAALRVATAQEVSDYDAAKATADATAMSRQRDVLATIAWAIRLKDPAAWAAKTLAQKRAAVLSESDNWRDIRVFVEQNL